MKNQYTKQELIVITAVLCAITVVTHLCVYAMGPALNNSEWANFLLAADTFQNSQWTPFAFQNSHGGLTITWLRAIWLWFWRLFSVSDSNHWTAHMSFSYSVEPVLMSICTFYFLKNFLTKSATLAVSTLFAIGFHFWIVSYGNDFYPTLYMLGVLFLSLRKHTNNPLLELSTARLFIASLLAGHAFYNSRAAQLFIVVFFVPTDWLWAQLVLIKLHLKKNKLTLRPLVALALFFGLLGLYIEIFGRELGQFNGKTIKLDAAPNFNIAGAIFIGLWIWIRKRDLTNIPIRRIGIALCGFIVGYLPELLYWLKQGRLTGPTVYARHDLLTSLQILKNTPEMFQSLIAGLHHYRGFSFRDPGIGQIFISVTALVGIIFVTKNAYHRRELRPYVLLFLLTIFAYTRIHLQTSEIAPARYLSTVFPTVLLGLGLIWEWFNARKKTWLALLAFAVIATHHFGARLRLNDELKQTHYIENMYTMIDIFRKEQMQVVVSDDLWSSMNLTVLANWNPGFTPTWGNWGTTSIEARLPTQSQIGILLHEEFNGPAVAQIKTIQLLETQWELKPIKKVGPHYLFIGSRI